MKTTYQLMGLVLPALLFAGACGSSENDADAGDNFPLTGGTTGTTTGNVTGAAGVTMTAGHGSGGTVSASTGGQGVAGMTTTSMGGNSGSAGMTTATAGTSGTAAGGSSGTAAGGSSGIASAGNGGAAGATTGTGMGMCCSTGDCLCHGDPPAAPTSKAGPYKTMSYDIPSAGCVFYPTDAEPPFAAVTVSDGFGGSGGCGPSQTGQWGPLYASWGIVAMIIHTGAGDQPDQRGMKLTAGVAAFKMENMKSGSPLMGKLSGRYGTSGFSMGGGGTTYSAAADPTLKSNVSIMAWQPTSTALKVPSLFIFGSSDTLAGTMGMAAFQKIMDPTPKMAVTIPSGHAGQPTSGMGKSGEAGLAFQKVFLEGDERWRPVLLMVKADQTNIK